MSKFEQYQELNEEYLTNNSQPSVLVDEDTKYLMRQQYLLGYIDGQADALDKMMSKGPM